VCVCVCAERANSPQLGAPCWRCLEDRGRAAGRAFKHHAYTHHCAFHHNDCKSPTGVVDAPTWDALLGGDAELKAEAQQRLASKAQAGGLPGKRRRPLAWPGRVLHYCCLACFSSLLVEGTHFTFTCLACHERRRQHS